jgi:hypothetical protein
MDECKHICATCKHWCFNQATLGVCRVETDMIVPVAYDGEGYWAEGVAYKEIHTAPWFGCVLWEKRDG